MHDTSSVACTRRSISARGKPASFSTWIIWTIARHSIATENIGWATMPRSRVVSR
jgi:hypothetical protein